MYEYMKLWCWRVWWLLWTSGFAQMINASPTESKPQQQQQQQRQHLEIRHKNRTNAHSQRFAVVCVRLTLTHEIVWIRKRNFANHPEVMAFQHTTHYAKTSTTKVPEYKHLNWHLHSIAFFAYMPQICTHFMSTNTYTAFKYGISLQYFDWICIDSRGAYHFHSF